MKIIFVIKSLKMKGGSERVATSLANLLNKELTGIELIIINEDTNSNDEISFPLDRGIKVISIGKKFPFIYNLQKLLKHEHPDYIIYHNMGKLSILGAFLTKKYGQSYSLEHTSYLGKSKVINFLSKLLYKRFNKIIVLTEQDKLYYSKFHNDVIKIPNFSPYGNSSTFYDTSSKRVIALGRLSKEKNFKALILAWAMIENRIPCWELEIYGSGPEYKMLRELIIERRLERVFLKGVCHDVVDLYKSSSFIVMSSIYEGLPMVLIEAQSLGLPSISFNCPHGPSQIITNGKDGILVDNQNIGELAEAIFLLCSNPELREEYSINGLKSSQRFSQTTILQEWKTLFKNG